MDLEFSGKCMSGLGVIHRTRPWHWKARPSALYIERDSLAHLARLEREHDWVASEIGNIPQNDLFLGYRSQNSASYAQRGCGFVCLGMHCSRR